MLQHEFLRPRNENLMSDVYDAPSWKDLMGEPVFPNDRIGNTHHGPTSHITRFLNN